MNIQRPSPPSPPSPTGTYPRGTYPRIEWTLQIPAQTLGATANPFDTATNDIRAVLQTPSGAEIILPAFYDGGETWRVRHRPNAVGKYSLRTVLRNNRPFRAAKIVNPIAPVSGRPNPGFVRRDAKNGFRFDNRAVYYPLGHNVGWGGRPGLDSADDIANQFAKMGAAGENWSRVWMCHWDGKNLDWVQGTKIPRGELDLTVAQRWDKIIEAAEKHGIFLQMVLQHHGQYSTTTNPNWQDNPWNRKNGGFLDSPEAFFTDEQARRLTRAKYRYILARWGSSPAVLAWELFNEVEWVDTWRKANRSEPIAAWHNEMAAFLRANDSYRHLVVTSSKQDIPGLYDAMDFAQPHVYSPDAVAAVRSPLPHPKGYPVFYGEFGPQGDLDADDGRFLSTALWTSVLSKADGAAQYWQWTNVERRNLYPRFQAVADFLKRTAIGGRPATPLALTIQSEATGMLAVGPGGGWGKAERSTFVVSASGDAIPGIERMPQFLQGNAHREMFPHAEFVVNYRKDGEFRVHVAQSAKAGAKIVLSVDGSPVTEQEFAAAERDMPVNATLTAKVPAGKHTIRLENTGADWVVIDRFTLTPYGAGFMGIGKGSIGKEGRDWAAFYLYRAPDAPPTPVSGTVTLSFPRPGKYRVLWWDTVAGKPLKESVVTLKSGSRLAVETPAFARDVVGFVRREG